MKKGNILLTCIAASIATFIGKETLDLQTSKTNTLLTQNVEALSQGDVTNGDVMKINPLYTKTCYHNYVNKDDFQTREMHEPSTNTTYTYEVYYHSYKPYTRTQCETMPIESAPFWWSNCDTPRQAKCDAGDLDKKPNPYEYYE